jgi:DNA-directed RNA polymerase subunit RPC12/RpoP
MNILTFMKEFPTESAFKAHFKLQREQEGIKCKKCGSINHYWLKAKDQWQCRDCEFRTTLKSGSIMSGSKVDFHTWYNQWRL